jgi:hypothetical protein
MNQQEKDELWFLTNEQSAIGLTDKQTKRLVVLEKKKRDECNGWKNYSTWNVSLWINNDEELYRNACTFMWGYMANHPYVAFIRSIGVAEEKTPDGIKWLSSILDYKALNAMMQDLLS